MSARWLPERVATFDTETTGVDPLNDRIVTATVLHVGREGLTHKREWLINPGVPISEGATKVHGITNEMAATGTPAADAIPDIATELLSAWALGLPVVVMSAPFDLTLINHELLRHGHEALTIGPVLDPLTIDRGCDPYRKGSRKLDALAAHYCVKQDTAHSAVGDALTAARVVWKQAYTHSRLAGLSLDEMQTWQRERHAEWAGQFELYLRNQGKPETINREWPVRRAA